MRTTFVVRAPADTLRPMVIRAPASRDAVWRAAWAVVAGLSASAAFGSPLPEMSQFHSDAVIDHARFGSAVGVSQHVVLVGTPFEEPFYDGVPGKGTVRIFDVSDPSFPTEIGALESDQAIGDRFGSAIAVCGDLALVGAYLDATAHPAGGAAYLFNLADPNQPVLIAKFGPEVPPTGTEVFGARVALSEDRALVGAPMAGPPVGAGAAYLFDTSEEGSPPQVRKLLPPDPNGLTRFGGSVAVAGPYAVVGARTGPLPTSRNGAAFLFDSATGDFLAELGPTHSDQLYEYGYCVAVDNHRAYVANLWGYDGIGSLAGSVFVFCLADPTTPVQVARLRFSGDEQYVQNLAIGAAGLAVALASDDVTGAGVIQVFTLAGLFSGQPRAELAASDGALGHNFGSALAMSGTSVVVGASSKDDPGPYTGGAYLFALPEGCPADLDANGLLNLDDIEAFSAGFLAADPIPDCDGSGVPNL